MPLWHSNRFNVVLVVGCADCTVAKTAAWEAAAEKFGYNLFFLPDKRSSPLQRPGRPCCLRFR